ncbi:MAG: hypothetical protein HYX68_26990 [Planctomycetes bacterium]|nr:hypothetical protein [Planctomycetota bacterium]
MATKKRFCWREAPCTSTPAIKRTTSVGLAKKAKHHESNSGIEAIRPVKQWNIIVLYRGALSRTGKWWWGCSLP